MPVQWVSRPSQEFRGFAGLITSGTVWLGDRLRVLPSGKESRVQRIVTFDGDLDRAVAGQSVTLTLEDEIDISRGDVLCAAAEPASVGDRLEAKVLWLSEQELRPNQNYLIKIGAKTLGATLAKPRHRLDINTLERAPADTLRLNETGHVDLLLDQRIGADLYQRSRETGSFIVIDRLSNDTVGMGFIERVLGVETIGLAAMEMPDGMEGAAAELLPMPEVEAPKAAPAPTTRARTFTVFNYRVTIEPSLRPAARSGRRLGSALRDLFTTDLPLWPGGVARERKE
jgi:sulfate adenylyltransferase subunit 1 (EFTu-like GTPase family)